MKKYARKFSINQFIRLSQAGLIDKEWIIDFQKKIMINTGQFVKIDGGMEGSYFAKNKKIIKKSGKLLLCKCNSIASVTFVKIKKEKTQINLYCETCMPKGKKIVMNSVDVVQLARAGLIDNSVATKVRNSYDTDNSSFDTEEAWGGMETQMASWVQEDLGIADGSSGGAKKCYICGTRVSDAMDRCPKCGSDL